MAYRREYDMGRALNEHNRARGRTGRSNAARRVVFLLGVIVLLVLVVSGALIYVWDCTVGLLINLLLDSPIGECVLLS